MQINNKLSNLVKFQNIGTRQGIVKIDNFLVQWGEVSISPPGDGDKGTETVVFEEEFSDIPFVVTNLGTALIANRDIVTSASQISTTQVNINYYATSTDPRTVMWLAIGQAVE